MVSPKRTVAFDWNTLERKKIILDDDIMLVMENDSASYHAFSTIVDGTSENFESNTDVSTLKDRTSGSTWNIAGLCIDGARKGKQLQRLAAYQEFWHSWKTFHPETVKYPAM